jgi:AAA domain
MKEQTTQQSVPFRLDFIQPYTTFTEGGPAPIPFVIDGLLTQSGFSVLAGKPKSGKSSLSRYEAVCVAKGAPFLGRDTVKGEVILISLEDPQNHTDNCLKSLGYDPKTDARIHLVEKLSPRLDETINAIGEALSKMPNVRLVIVDTLAKMLRVGDLNEYMPTLRAVEQLHNLARQFPNLHVQGLVHCKKVKTDDPFDSVLGSTALRGEPDTSIVLYNEDRQRLIATETRIGRNIEPTILNAELVNSAGVHVVKDFSLARPFAEWKSENTEKTERKRKTTHEQRIITYLQGCAGNTAKRELILDAVEGKRTLKIAALDALTEAGVITVTGTEQSKTDPLVLRLNQDSLRIHDFMQKFGGDIN